MPRDNDDRYDDDYASPPKPRPSIVLYVVLAVFGVVLLMCIGGSLLFFVWAKGTAKRIEEVRMVEAEARMQAEVASEARLKAEAAARKAKVYPRDVFRDLVMGKTEGEVLDLMGEPDRKEDKGVDDLTYFYDKKTLDPATGKIDATTAVKFKFGRVDLVRY